MNWRYTKNWQYGLGVVWAIAGAFFTIALGIISVVVPPPKLPELTVIHTLVLHDPEVSQSSRVPWFLKIRTEAGDMRIQNICFIWDCGCDCASIKGFSVRRGDRISVWTRGRDIWQLTSARGIVLTLDAVTKAHRAYERRGFAFSLGMLFLGVILTYWGIRRERFPTTIERDAGKGSRPLP